MLFRHPSPLSLAFAFTLGLAPSGCVGESAGPAHAQEAPARDPHDLVAQGATLLDVRTEGEYAARHLEGAVLIPVDQIEARASEISRERPVVVYCQSGARAERAATMLRRRGYDVVVLGGIGDW